MDVASNEINYIVNIIALIILTKLFFVRGMEKKHYQVRLCYNFNLIRFIEVF